MEIKPINLPSGNACPDATLVLLVGEVRRRNRTLRRLPFVADRVSVLAELRRQSFNEKTRVVSTRVSRDPFEVGQFPDLEENFPNGENSLYLIGVSNASSFCSSHHLGELCIAGCSCR